MHDLRPRTRAAIIAIFVWMIADLGVALSGAVAVAALGGTGAIWSMRGLQNVDRFSSIAAVGYLVAFFLSALCVGRWIYRASANAHAVSDAMTISPRWSVGFFFMPIANLFKPFQAFRETWQASIAPDDPASVAVPIAMRVWWGLWLLSNVLGNVSFRLAASGSSIRTVVTGGWIDIIAFLVDVPMALALIWLIRRLDANQRELVDTRIFA